MSGICGVFGESGELKAELRGLTDSMLLEGEVPQWDVIRTAGLGVCRRWPKQTVERHGDLCIAADLDLVSTDALAALVARYERSAELSQAQLIAAAYSQVGLKVLDVLEGSFAFAIWNENKREGILAVDRVGARTVFWSRQRERLIFASRPSAIAQMIGPRENADALVQFMMFSVVTAPLSAFKDVQRLAPGHVMLWENGECRDQEYWDITYEEQGGRSEAYWADNAREQLRGAVHRYSSGLQDEECGAFLSGGTDSSTVTAFLSEVHKPARTYSIYMEDEAFSEIDFARTASECFNTDHHEYSVSAEDAIGAFEKLATYYDEPFANSSAIGGYYCARMAQQSGVKTLLAGDGGDEIFAGNERYHSDRKFAVYHDIPGWLRRFAIEPLARITPRIGKLALFPKYVSRAALTNPRRILSYNFLLSSPPETLLSQDILRAAPPSTWLQIAQAHFDRPKDVSELNRLLYLDVKITLADNDLRKVVGTAELAGVQVRFPMLDRQLMEFTGKIPSDLKLRGAEKRYIFKQAMKPILPDKILYKKKHGFGIPVSIWLLRDKRMNEMMNDLMHDQKTRQRGIFAPGLFDTLIQLHGSQNAGYYGEIVWYVLMLEMWCRRHLDAKPVPVGKGA